MRNEPRKAKSDIPYAGSGALAGWRRMLLLALGVFAAAVMACGGDSDAGESASTGAETETQSGGTLRVAMSADTNTLDPALSTSSMDLTATQAMYDNLLLRQPDLSLRPQLAVSWEPNEDLSEYTFNLRQGVKFHHGKDFNADDVVFTFKRLLDPETGSPAASALDSISDVVKVDEYTVRFDLKGPNAFFPDTLSLYQGRIIPSDVDETMLATQDFGTGPFTLVEHKPTERTVFKRFEDYWDPNEPGVDELIFFYMPEPETRTEAIKSGQVDVLYPTDAVSVSGLNATQGVTVSEVASGSYVNLALRTDMAPFDNKLVRKAIQAATNREAIRQAVNLGGGAVGNDFPIPPNDPHAPDLQAPEYDVEAAKEYLAQAGFRNGIDLTLHTSTVTPGMVEMAVAFKEFAEPAGIRVNIVRDPEDIYWTDVWLTEPFTTVGWNGRNPDQALSIVYKSGAEWNEAYWDSPELDNLIDTARGQETIEERSVTYEQIGRLLIDEAVRIIPTFRPIFVSYRDNVTGVSAHPSNWLLLHDARINN